MMEIDETNEVMMNHYKKQELIKAKKRLDEKMSKAEILKNETEEFQNKQFENIMTGLFSEDEIYLESLLKSKYQTKLFIDFINRVFDNYLKCEINDKIEARKRIILKELYIKGKKQSEFIFEYYEVERTFYTDKDKLIKDLAPYFFRYKRYRYIKLF